MFTRDPQLFATYIYTFACHCCQKYEGPHVLLLLYLLTFMLASEPQLLLLIELLTIHWRHSFSFNQPLFSENKRLQQNLMGTFLRLIEE